jgi:hypothetical protein
MIMTDNISRVQKVFTFLLALFLLSSCQKELTGDTDAGGGTLPPASEKPKVGTIWTYHYYIYNLVGGGIHSTEVLKFKAKAEEVLGGEKWLNIVDMAADTTVFYLNQKAGGLYQYANNTSNLLCKDPAAVGDTYTSFNDKSTEDFTVKGVKDTLQTGIGDIPANYYEGIKLTKLIDQVWYNENAWIVRRHFFFYRELGPIITYYRKSSLYLDKIEY